MNSRVVKSLYKKEMLDVLRDKKTVLMMLVVPLVLYPLVFIAGLTLMTSISTGMSERTYNIALTFDDNDELSEYLGEDFDISYVDNPEDALADEDIDAYIERVDADGVYNYKVYYVSAVTNSSYAVNKISDSLDLLKEHLIEKKLKEEGLNPKEVLNPVQVSYIDMASNEESAGSLLGTILPFMLIVSLMLGTMYPAIDTTAGERERGTLETILTLPVSNHELIMSKFLTVATIGVASAILNIISMCGVGAYMYNMMQKVSDSISGIDMTKFVPAIIVGVLCVLAFAIFMSAITMCVCAFAKSYKEANNYITPLMLVIMFASFIGFIPNVTLTANMALVPVANICLLIRDLLAFKINIGIIAIVLMSNVVYGILAITFLGRIYNSESILFGDGSAGVQIFERRSNMRKGGVPTIGDAWLVIAVAAVAVVYLGSMMQLSFGYYGILGTQVLILLLPMLAAIYTKKSIKDTFRIRSFRLKELAGSILIIFGVILLGVLLTAFTSMIFKSSAENVQADTTTLLGDSFLKTLLVVALAPAICEELMFRGYIFSAFEAKLKPVWAVVLSASIFGVYHMSIVKFFTTALIGGAICMVAHWTKSIFPGMIMHFINNGISVLFMYYPVKMAKILPVFGKEVFGAIDVAVLFTAGMAFVILGFLLMRKQLFKHS